MRTEFPSSLSTALARSSTNFAQRGGWPLAAGHASTLEATEASVLRVRAGRIWLTRDASRGGASEDIVLDAGSAHTVAAGERVVVESWSARAGETAWFEWEPLAGDPASATAWAPATRYQAVLGSLRSAINSIAGRARSVGHTG
jgi:Protein of unknown function (DUF2917)